MISKMYPALFIDCRNIFILSSRNMLVSGKASNNETVAPKPAAIATNTAPSKSGKTAATQASPVKPITNSVKSIKQMVLPSTQVQGEPSTLAQGVMTRAAAAKLPAACSESFQSSASDDPNKILDNGAVSKVSPAESIFEPEESMDTATVSSGSLSAKENINPYPVECPLLTDLSEPGKAGLGGGKFGHIPSARMVRNGYNQCRIPVMTRSKVIEEGLFLDNKDTYRGKDVKEAAGLIENILHGKTEKVGGETLREIKMKRVEGFLKDKLCVSSETVDTSSERKNPGNKRPGEGVEASEVNNNVLINEEKMSVIPGKDGEVELTAKVLVVLNKDD